MAYIRALHYTIHVLSDPSEWRTFDASIMLLTCYLIPVNGVHSMPPLNTIYVLSDPVNGIHSMPPLNTIHVLSDPREWRTFDVHYTIHVLSDPCEWCTFDASLKYY